MVERGETLLQVDWSMASSGNSLEVARLILIAGFSVASVWFLVMHKKPNNERVSTQATHDKPIDTE
jgi:hypothetical protein